MQQKRDSAGPDEDDELVVCVEVSVRLMLC